MTILDKKWVDDELDSRLFYLTGRIPSDADVRGCGEIISTVNAKPFRGADKGTLIAWDLRIGAVKDGESTRDFRVGFVRGKQIHIARYPLYDETDFAEILGVTE